MPEYDSEALAATQAERPDVNFEIRKLYLKDSSFESPNSPSVFATREWNPNVDFHLHTETANFGASTYEVTLRTTVTVTNQERTLYLAEVTVAGLFAVSGIGKEGLPPLLGSYCPSILFPYLREVVSDLSVRGGFPQLVLRPVNFEALYQRHRQQEGEGSDA